MIFMFRREKFERILKGSNGNSVRCEVSYTNTAWAECDNKCILQLVAADLVCFATDYLLAKNEMERFTIVCESGNTLITGIIVYKDDLEMGLKITNVYNDVSFVSEHQKGHC